MSETKSFAERRSGILRRGGTLRREWAAGSTLRTSLLVLLALVSCACERATDVAGYVLTADGTTQPPPIDVPDIVEPEMVTPVVEPPPDSGAPAPTSEPPLVVGSSTPDAGTVPTAPRGEPPPPRPRLDGGLSPTGPGVGFPMGSDAPELDGDALWISGWPLQGPPSAVVWPLEVPFFEFFGPGAPGFQVGVWARGEQAHALMGWWLSIPPDAPEVLVFNGQRFVVTTDFLGDVFAVSAELPPEGTELLVPIPEGPPQ